MTFGRPYMALNMPTFPPTGIVNHISSLPNSEPEHQKLQFHEESVRLSKILEGILSKIYQPWLHRNPTGEPTATPVLDIAAHYSLDDTVELHAQLDGFERSVRAPLSWSSLRDQDVQARDYTILQTQRNVLHARSVLCCTPKGMGCTKEESCCRVNSLKQVLIFAFDAPPAHPQPFGNQDGCFRGSGLNSHQYSHRRADVFIRTRMRESLC